MKIKDPRGFALYMVLGFLAMASMGATALVRMGGTETLYARNYFNSKQAFYEAEAAAENAKALLNVNYTDPVAGENQTYTLGNGEYRYTVTTVDQTRKRITGFGAVPDFQSAVSERSVEVGVRKPPSLPGNFFDHAIYAADDVDANGDAYQVDGNVIYGDAFEATQMNFNSESITQDPTINPLAKLDFEALKTVAMSQVRPDGNDNYYPLSELGNNGTPFPTGFYFQAPDPADPTDLGIPNIVFVEGDLTLNGQWGEIGGFVIVVGDIVTNPSGDPADTTVNGNGTINGVVYTTGTFSVNGGGNGLNVDGGVIAGEDAVLNGNTHITYNDGYMDSINNFNPPAAMTVEYWREIESP